MEFNWIEWDMIWNTALYPLVKRGKKLPCKWSPEKNIELGNSRHLWQSTRQLQWFHHVSPGAPGR